MQIQEIIDILQSRYDDLVIKNAYGEIALMLNPNNMFTNGKYFCTFKTYDGPNDKSSNLDRDDDTFRLNLKISKERFKNFFNQSKIPARAPKGKTVLLENYHNNFTCENEILTHPVYGWLSWACVINPSKKLFNSMLEEGFFDDAYNNAKSLIK